MRDDGPTYNVIEVWKMGYTGKGIVVGVVDTGLEKDHPELKNNFVSTGIICIKINLKELIENLPKSR